LFPNPSWLASRPQPWSSLNSCPIYMCRKLQTMFLFRGGQSGERSQLLVKSRQSLCVTNTVINFTTTTTILKYAPSQCTVQYQPGILFARSPKFLLHFPNVILPVSPPNIFLVWFRTRIIGSNLPMLITNAAVFRETVGALVLDHTVSHSTAIFLFAFFCLLACFIGWL